MNYKKLTTFLNSKYPERTAEKWDTVGVTFGNKKQTINKVIVALDLTSKIVDEAIQKQVDAIIVHHPFIFKGSLEEEILTAPYKERMSKRITNTGLCIYSMHTNFDRKDMSKALIEQLGFSKSSSIPGTKYGRIVKTDTTVNALMKLIKKQTKLETITTNNIKGKGNKVAFLPGSGSMEDILLAQKAGAKIIVTSDIKWSDKVTINELDINVVEVPHNIENVFVEHISNLLTKKFKGLEVVQRSSKEIFKL